MPNFMPALPLVSATQAADLLAQGQIVAIPTETVYGLAADARNAEAVARIYSDKPVSTLFV